MVPLPVSSQDIEASSLPLPLFSCFIFHPLSLPSRLALSATLLYRCLKAVWPALIPSWRPRSILAVAFESSPLGFPMGMSPSTRPRLRLLFLLDACVPSQEAHICALPRLLKSSRSLRISDSQCQLIPYDPGGLFLLLSSVVFLRIFALSEPGQSF